MGRCIFSPPCYLNGATRRLNRFTLRGQVKVNTQWHLYCLVHNVEKLAHHGYAQYAAGIRLAQIGFLYSLVSAEQTEI